MDEPKLSLFDLAYGAKLYQTAIATLHPMLLRSGLIISSEQNAAGADVENQDQYYTQQFLGPHVQYGADTSAALDPAQRAQIARKLADSYTKLNMPNEATFCYRIVLQFDRADAESNTRLDSLVAQLERKRVNGQRQPVITENLEQDHPVRPRLGGGQ